MAHVDRCYFLCYYTYFGIFVLDTLVYSCKKYELCSASQFFSFCGLFPRLFGWTALDSQSRGIFSKPQGGFNADSAFHPSDVDKMSARNFWELNGKK